MTDESNLIICPDCETAFEGSVVSHVIRGPHEAVYHCPKETCANVIVAAPPEGEDQ